MHTAIHHKFRLFGSVALVLCVVFFILSWGASAAAKSSSAQDNRLQPEAVRKAVKRHIQRYAPWDEKQMRIRDIKFNHALKVPAGNIEIDVVTPRHTDWIGATAFTAFIMVDGKRAARLTIPVNIEVWSDVVLSAKPLGKYQPIDMDDIQVLRMNLARVPANAIIKIDEAIGCRANRNIAANTILRTDQVEVPPIVKRGDIVQVVAKTPALQIAVKGMVRQKGGRGERIKVINLRSKKIIYAKVIDEQTVQVEF